MIRLQLKKVELGGNCLNASVVLARLGVKVQLVTKLGNDQLGAQLLSCCNTEGIYTDGIVCKPNITSPFSYIIVDSATKTRTCIYNPCEELQVDEIRSIYSHLKEVELVVFDGKHCSVALEVAKEAHKSEIFMLLDAEVECLNVPSFPELFELCNLVKCGEQFPIQFTGKQDLLEAMESLLKRGKKTCIITTLGVRGSILIKRGEDKSALSIANLAQLEDQIGHVKAETHPVQITFQLDPKWQLDQSTLVIYSTTYPLSHSELVDTTGAGDVYLGAICYSVLKGQSHEKMLSLASFVSAMKCKTTGIKGIPSLQDIPEEFR